jgi:hypothetical protein
MARDEGLLGGVAGLQEGQVAIALEMPNQIARQEHHDSRLYSVGAAPRLSILVHESLGGELHHAAQYTKSAPFADTSDSAIVPVVIVGFPSRIKLGIRSTTLSGIMMTCPFNGTTIALHVATGYDLQASSFATLQHVERFIPLAGTLPLD